MREKETKIEQIPEESLLERVCKKHNFNDVYDPLANFLPLPDCIESSTIQNMEKDPAFQALEKKKEFIEYMQGDKELDEKVKKGTEYLNDLIEKTKSEGNRQNYGKILSILKQDPENLVGVLKDYYTSHENIKGEEFVEITAHKEPKAGYVRQSNRGSKIITYVTLGALVVSIIGGGILFSRNKNLEKKLQEASERIIEQSRTLYDKEDKINSLEEQIRGINEKPAETVIVEYVSSTLKSGGTITDGVVTSLNRTLGERYRSLSFAGRIKLINNLSNLVFKTNGLNPEKARKLPVGYNVLIPEMNVNYENEKWRLTCEYVNKNTGEVEQRILKEESYKP